MDSAPRNDLFAQGATDSGFADSRVEDEQSSPILALSGRTGPPPSCDGSQILTSGEKKAPELPAVHVPSFGSGKHGPERHDPSWAAPEKMVSARELNVLTADGGNLASEMEVAVETPRTAAASAPSDVRLLLLAADRENASLKEMVETLHRDNEAVRSALRRETENAATIRFNSASELANAREEFDRQQSKLLEQITILKGLGDAALSDKAKAADEGHRAQRRLLGLMEKEREEKEAVMSEYRQETEQLIQEQAHEVTTLRSSAERARQEVARLSADLAAADARREEFEERLVHLERTLAAERLDAQRIARDAEEQKFTALQALKNEHARIEETAKRELLRASAQRDALEDRLKSLQENFKAAKMQHESARMAAKEAQMQAQRQHEAEVAQWQIKLEKAEVAHARDLQRALGGEKSVTQSLKNALETLRGEKARVEEEFARWREEHASRHDYEQAKAQEMIAELQEELREERERRKEKETAAASATLTADTLQATVHRLTAEMSQMEADHQQRAREALTGKHEELECCQDALREAENDNKMLRTQLQKVDVELQKLCDEDQARRRRAEALQNELSALRAKHATEIQKFERLLAEGRKQQSAQLDDARAKNVQLEADVGRLSRLLSECETRMESATRQLVEERRALETALKDLHAAKTENRELRSDVEHGHRAMRDMTAALTEREADVSTQQAHIGELEQKIHALSAALEEQRAAVQQRLREEERAVAAAEAARRRDREELEAHLASARDQQRRLDNRIKDLESELEAERRATQQARRDVMARDERHEEALRCAAEQFQDELRRVDEVLSATRSELAAAQREKLNVRRDAAQEIDAKSAECESVLSLVSREQQAKQRLHEELRNKEQLLAEAQGTVRLLQGRSDSASEESEHLKKALAEAMERIQELHGQLGRKDALLGQLHAKLQLVESVRQASTLSASVGNEENLLKVTAPRLPSSTTGVLSSARTKNGSA